MKLIKYLSITGLFMLTAVGSSFAQSYEFELQDINGNNVKLSSLLDKGPVMMSFWALWCVLQRRDERIQRDI